jgi:hypothetical protein
MTNIEPSLSPARSGLILKAILFSLSVALVACGGPKTDTNTPEPGGTEDSAPVTMVGDPVTAPDPAPVALPDIPASPAAAPASLMAEVILGNPNAQLTKVGTFVDAVQPGMGAFVTPQTFMQMLEGMNGATGIEGVDLNGPLYITVLDGEKIVTIVTMSSEAKLRSSLEGGRAQVLTHEGFAAFGHPAALAEVGPYALSNLVNQAKPELPTLNLHMGKIMDSSQGEMIRAQIKQGAGNAEAAVGQTVVDVFDNIETLRASLDAQPSGATVRLVADVPGGPLKGFLAKQRPSDYSMLNRIGTGPWGIAAAGRIDVSAFAPVLVKLGEAEANPIITQVAAQLPSLSGEMAMGLNMPDKPEFVMELSLIDPKGIAQVVDTLMALAAKKKDQEIDGMPAKLKLRSIKTRGGSLHELSAKPTTPKQIEMYGKKKVSAFFGVAVNSFIATFGNNAKKHAKTLVTAKGKLAGKGSKLAAAAELSKSARESLLISVDALSLQGKRAPKDVDPLIIGVGFTDKTIEGRLVVPTALVKEAASMGFF